LNFQLDSFRDGVIVCEYQPETTVSDPKQLTIRDFLPGSPYQVGAVARFLKCTTETVRNMIADGRLKAVRTNPFAANAGASSHYLIDGAEIRRYYGCQLLEQDRKAAVPRPGSAEKRAAKRLRELEKIQ